MKQAHLDARHLVVTPLAALALALFSVVFSAGCADDVDNSTYQPQPMAFAAIGSFAKVDFDGGEATATMKHGGDGCIDSLAIDATSADGNNKLKITFAPRGKFGMAVATVKWQPSGDTAFGGDGDGAWLPLDTITDTEVSSGKVDKLLIAPRGKVKLEQPAPGDQVAEFDLSTIQFGGDVTTSLDKMATCKRCDPKSADSDSCKAPYPTWRTRDFQTKSAWLNLEYDMNVFLGRPVVAILTQGW